MLLISMPIYLFIYLFIYVFIYLFIYLFIKQPSTIYYFKTALSYPSLLIK